MTNLTLGGFKSEGSSSDLKLKEMNFLFRYTIRCLGDEKKMEIYITVWADPTGEIGTIEAEMY